MTAGRETASAGVWRLVDGELRREETLGIKEGESTPDLAFYLETVACLGTCFLALVMMIDHEYFGMLTAQKIETILRSYREREP